MSHSAATSPPWHPSRATAWQLRTRTLACGRLPLVMGIVNVTPDSFSDGGRFATLDAALAQAERLAAEGADLLDVGGESTRPYSTPVAVEEERRRVEPLIRELCRRVVTPVSVDTSKADVARAALDAGAEVINDVTGLTGDPAMLPLAVASQAGVCAMHMRGTPLTMQDDPRYDDVVAEIGAYLRDRRDLLERAGVERARIALDPGIGFGKTHQHNLTLMAQVGRYHELGCPLLVGHSRKGFIAKVLGDKLVDRTAGTVGAALALARQGVQILRVHDVAPLRQALLVFAACGGIDGQAAMIEPD